MYMYLNKYFNWMLYFMHMHTCVSHVVCYMLQAKPEAELKVGSVQCDVCKIVVEYVQKFVDNNSTEVRTQSSIHCITHCTT